VPWQRSPGMARALLPFYAAQTAPVKFASLVFFRGRGRAMADPVHRVVMTVLSEPHAGCPGDSSRHPASPRGSATGRSRSLAAAAFRGTPLPSTTGWRVAERTTRSSGGSIPGQPRRRAVDVVRLAAFLDCGSLRHGEKNKGQLLRWGIGDWVRCCTLLVSASRLAPARNERGARAGPCIGGDQGERESPRAGLIRRTFLPGLGLVERTPPGGGK
jgi:hypothetical protein